MAMTLDERCCSAEGLGTCRPSPVEFALAATGLAADRCLYWWSHPGKVFNFGDWVGPFLFEAMTGHRPIRYRPKFSPFGRSFFTVGSILRWIRRPRSATIWGSGVMSAKDRFPTPRETLAVRGPLTRLRMHDLGYSCPDVFGDPAILLPRFIRPRGDRKYALGIVPHYHDLPRARAYLDREGTGSDEIRLIDVRRPVRAVVEDIASCAAIASSSLHGLIVAHAYGVPALRVSFGARIGGDGTKFADHFLAAGLTPAEAQPVEDGTPLSSLTRMAAGAPIPDLGRIAERLMTVCPFPRTG